MKIGFHGSIILKKMFKQFNVFCWCDKVTCLKLYLSLPSEIRCSFVCTPKSVNHEKRTTQVQKVSSLKVALYSKAEF